jgi:hypothetical protein
MVRLAVAGLHAGSFTTPDGDEYNLSVTMPKNTPVCRHWMCSKTCT